MLTIANSGDSKLLSLYFFRLREPPYWMLFSAEVDTKLCEGSITSRVFICKQTTRIIYTRHTPRYFWLILSIHWGHKTFGQVLNISDPRDSMPVSSTLVMDLNPVAQKQELRIKGLLLSPCKFLPERGPREVWIRLQISNLSEWIYQSW